MKLWAEYGSTLTRLMPGKTRLVLEPDPVLAPPPSAPPKPALRAPPPAGPISIDKTPAGLDKSTWKKFASGRLPAERRLDLHGMTAMRAHHAVQHFLAQAHAQQLPCIEIITGKGEILARELPHWLNAAELRKLILAIAHPHAANTGSVRILLRRQR